MAGASERTYSEPLKLLWGAGTCAGLSDGQLLARFLAGSDEAGELAFEVLVKRHGPMVARACHQVLDDPCDIHDAWQAVFLVLARRAGAIRNRESVGGWLYGVAVRLARRTRMTALRRRLRDRRIALAAEDHALEAPAPHQVHSLGIEREERAEIVHHEISRLPEKYRAPVVLCYMEGLTHDEAAASLSWPVGTVRSRLSRGRERLRRRLSRRGIGVTAAVGPLGAWLAGKGAAVEAVDAIPGNLAAEVVKLVSQSAAGRLAAGGSSESRALALADGVLKMLMLKKISIVAMSIVALATVTVGGGVAIVRTSQAQVAKSKSVRSDQDRTLLAAPAKAVDPIDVDRQRQEILTLARSLCEMQYRLYQNVQCEVENAIDASDQLEKAESSVASGAAERKAVKERNLTRLKKIEQCAEARLLAARGNQAAVHRVKLRRIQVELELKTGETEDEDLPAVLRRLKALEKKVEQLEKRVP
jgi:RNA polymerase sigma factor (sigma-70 family)